MKPSIPRPKSGSSPFQGPGLSRRGFVELSVGGLVASWFLRSPAAAMAAENAGVIPRNTAKNAIFVFLPGAPSQIDTLDPKPHAPAQVRGEFKAISTSIPGIAASELLPNIARNLHRVAIQGEFGRLTVEIENVPSENPRTGKRSYLSTIALLKDLNAPLRVGT